MGRPSKMVETDPAKVLPTGDGEPAVLVEGNRAAVIDATSGGEDSSDPWVYWDCRPRVNGGSTTNV